MGQGRNAHGKINIKMKRLPKPVRSDKFLPLRTLLRLSSDCADSGWHVTAFDLRRTTRGFHPILQAALTTLSIVVLDRFRPGSAPSFNHSMYVCTGQNRMMLTYTPRRLNLGIHLPEVDSRSLRELKFFWLILFSSKLTFSSLSMDRFLVLMNSLVLCRSSYEPSDFIRVATSCVHISDELKGQRNA